jgi:LPXTG cell wall anchor motif
MKKLGGAVVAVIVGLLVWASPLGAAAPVIQFASSGVTATLPACTVESCTWTLSVDVPATGHVIGVVSGTAGVLSVAVPPICGVVQADISLNGAHGFGHRHTYSTCPPGSTTTTTSTTSTTTPSATTTTPGSGCAAGGFAGCSGGGNMQPPPAAGPTAPVASSTAPAAPVAHPAAPAATTAPQLPYTGVDVTPYAVVGGGLVVIGLLLMSRRNLFGL